MAIYRESCSIDPNSKDFLVGDFSFNQQVLFNFKPPIVLSIISKKTCNNEKIFWSSCKSEMGVR